MKEFAQNARRVDELIDPQNARRFRICAECPPRGTPCPSGSGASGPLALAPAALAVTELGLGFILSGLGFILQGLGFIV